MATSVKKAATKKVATKKTTATKPGSKKTLATATPKPRKPRASRAKPKAAPVKQNVNHVIFVVDESGSMQNYQNVRGAFSGLATSFSQTAKDQITLGSLYQFHSSVKQVFNDVDIASLNLNNWRPQGMTALVDGAYAAIKDGLNLQERLKRFNTDQNHAFLVYILTDGEENQSSRTAYQLQQLIGSLDDAWTIAALVPNARGEHMVKQLGIPAGNIERWDVNSARGFEEAADRMSQTYSGYTHARSLGATKSTTLFANAAAVTKADAKAVLHEVPGRLVSAQKVKTIREFVEDETGRPYIKGSTFYELVKPEIVQPQKEMILINKKDRKKYGGDVRGMLGLVAGTNVRVRPGDHGDWRIFVQSTSVNRRIPANTSIFIKD